MVSVSTLEQYVVLFLAVALLSSPGTNSFKKINQERKLSCPCYKTSDCWGSLSCCHTGLSPLTTKKCQIDCINRYCVNDYDCGRNENCWKHACITYSTIGLSCDYDSDCGGKSIVCCHEVCSTVTKDKCSGGPSSGPSLTVITLAGLVAVLSLIILIGMVTFCIWSSFRCRRNCHSDEEVPLTQDTAEADPNAHRQLEQQQDSLNAQPNQQDYPGDPPPQYLKRPTGNTSHTDPTRERDCENPPPYSSLLEDSSRGACSSTHRYGAVSQVQ